MPPASPPPATAAPPAGPRALMIFVPPGHKGTFVTAVYDDDGESNAYATGGYCVFNVTVAVTAGAALAVNVMRTGTWTPPYTEVALVLPPGDTRSFVSDVAPIMPA